MNSMNKKRAKTRILTECAILIALSAVLSLVKIWKMPWGGSVTLFSMLPVCFISVRHGLKWGFLASTVYAVMQLFFGTVLDGLLGWGLTAGMLIACILLDYVVPFLGLGIAGAFRKYGRCGIICGVMLALFIRFSSHYLSGVYVFASVGKLWEGFETNNPHLYSLVYNACYMIPELIMTALGIFLLTKTKLFSKD